MQKEKNNLSILGLKENANADFSKKTIAKDEKISKIFKKRNLDLNKAKSSTRSNPKKLTKSDMKSMYQHSISGELF